MSSRVSASSWECWPEKTWSPPSRPPQQWAPDRDSSRPWPLLWSLQNKGTSMETEYEIFRNSSYQCAPTHKNTPFCYVFLNSWFKCESLFNFFLAWYQTLLNTCIPHFTSENFTGQHSVGKEANGIEQFVQVSKQETQTLTNEACLPEKKIKLRGTWVMEGSLTLDINANAELSFFCLMLANVSYCNTSIKATATHLTLEYSYTVQIRLSYS